MSKKNIESCAKILDCEGKNEYDSKLTHRILILAGHYVTEESVRTYIESLEKKTLSLQELKDYVKKNNSLNPPSEDEIRNLFKLLDVSKSGEIDLDLLKYGLTTVGSNKFNSTETEEFFKALDINASETKSVKIEKLVEGLSKMLSIFK
ncbi:hypothetical protein FG386_001923 [Cryptosporidium ryanae]|uniref:uncharacterized protein n=1 Tax=Cryptosporidium ryanae TaxID=515981 RepID=UPI00351A4120|nr:hypothetical protein FG386_001923 [Cryptosporidium ryanae]